MNNRKITFLWAMTLVIGMFSCSNKNEKSTVNQPEAKIDSLLSVMTVEEKAGEMTQLTLDYICKGKAFDESKEMVIDPVKLDSALLYYHVGSILNTGAYTLSREKWYELIRQIQEVATKKSRLKIPVLYGVDAIHGATYTQGSTLFPQELALAATFEPSFAEQAGAITAYEVRGSGIPWNFSPVLDLGRQPLWSRFFETFGEDPYLATQMGDAMIKGYQGGNLASPDKVAACLKHYMGYSFSTTGKDRTPVLMPERLMREYYMVPFASAIKNGALTVMVNSTEINGTPVHANYHMLTEILKGELKFEGFAVTDWEDIIMLNTVHCVAPTYKDAVALAINAGIDMSMVPSDVNFHKYLVELINEKRIPMSRIDDAVRRILRVKMKLGLFERPISDYNYYTKFGSQESAETNYRAALECITLLKNEKNTLPISKDKKVLLTGVAANLLNPLNGAWTHTWQGQSTKYNPVDKKTILQAVTDKVGPKNVVYVEGTTYNQDVNSANAVAAAKNVDMIIACLGEEPGTEKVGDIEDLEMEEAQLNLVKELSKTGKPIVLILAENRPRLIRKIEPLVSAVVMAYLPGNEGGRALAEVVYGDFNPCGKLPFTYPKYSGSLVTYDHKLSEKRDKYFQMNAFNPQYTFGSGLSYTTFAYSELALSKDTLSGSDTLTVSVKVTNTGERAGKEVVQLYTRDDYASITPSVKRLKRFSKIELQPGETKTVRFTLGASDLAFVNNDNKWITEPGSFGVMVDGLKSSFIYK
ncbi:MAG TPA: glycoside hydrolase family 3 N-terminal domain-containing protein [Cytophagaceae bacterium]|nr:glycoside hydrolase family 3 N-terminal domain-containing protein [Cytophagaceae bacterium]